jgi:hypothetical protein
MFKLNHQWTKDLETAYRYLERLGIIMSGTLYHILGMVHLALITDAGLLIMLCIPILFHDQLIPQPISVAFLLGYVVCDLVRFPFRHGATISLGFPLIFLTLLADSPFAALFNATLGSLISEALRSIFVSKQRHPWFPALRRALFYAGHHAVAGWGALLVYQLTYGHLVPSLLETTDIDIPATLAYIVVYSLISMLLVWPHDRRIQLFLAPNEDPFVRIDFLTTLLLLPLPAAVFYLFDHSNLRQADKILIAVGILPPLFVGLFYLARNFTKVQEEREQLALREEIGELLGSPANMAEMMERMLTIMDRLVDHRWGAVYSLDNEELRLCGVKPAVGPVEILDSYETEETWWPSVEIGRDKGQVAWPTRVKLNEGILGKLARITYPPQFFDEGKDQITSSDPYLPRKTALVVYPITTVAQGEAEKAFPRLIGMLALARPKRMFTTWDWEKGQALSSKAANVLLNVQRLESASQWVEERRLEEEWQRAKQYIDDVLFTSGSITLDQLTSIARPDQQFAWSRYLDMYRPQFDFVEAPPIRFRNEQGLNSFNKAWERLLSTVTPQGAIEDIFDQCAKEIVEQVRLAGFQELISEPLPRHPRLLTFLLDTKLALEDTKLPSSVPLVFVRRSEITEEDISEIRDLLHTHISPSCNLAFVVVPGPVAPRQRIEDLLRQKLTPYACDFVLLGLRELQHIIVALEPQTVVRHLVLSKINLINVSPFITTGPTSENIFFGREKELQEICQHIATISYAIIGGRRIGKSSLLVRLHRVSLPATGFRTIYHDCSSTPTYEAFLTAAIYDWKLEPPCDVPATFGDLLQSPPSDKPLVLLLDEADKLVPTDRAQNWRLFNALRALANSDRAQVVLGGERTLRDALQDPTGPLFNFANEMLLGPLDFHAVEELVTRPMKQLEINLVGEKSIVDRIWGFTSGHPNVVQRICHRLIERLNEQGTRHITLNDVTALIEDPRFQREDFLNTYWQNATLLERILSLLLAQEVIQQPYTLRDARRLLDERIGLAGPGGLKPSGMEVDAALSRLADLRSILEHTPQGYTFAVSAFPEVVTQPDIVTIDDLFDMYGEAYSEYGDVTLEEVTNKGQG